MLSWKFKIIKRMRYSTNKNFAAKRICMEDNFIKLLKYNLYREKVISQTKNNWTIHSKNLIHLQYKMCTRI